MRKVQKYRNIWLFFDRPPTSHWYASARGTILNYDGARDTSADIQCIQSIIFDEQMNNESRIVMNGSI